MTLWMRAGTVRVRSGNGHNAREVPLWGLYHDVPRGAGRAPPGYGTQRDARSCVNSREELDSTHL